jgi:hypothetical protein
MNDPIATPELAHVLMTLAGHTVEDIVTATHAPRAEVYQALTRAEHAGIVRRKRRGTARHKAWACWYSIPNPPGPAGSTGYERLAPRPDTPNVTRPHRCQPTTDGSRLSILMPRS